MAIRTDICELFNIDHPIIEAGIGRYAEGGVVETAKLAAEVTNAGGLGQIGHASYGEGPNEQSTEYLKERTRIALQTAIERTDGPLGINVRLANPEDSPAEVIRTIIEERERSDEVRRQLRVLFTSAGPPDCFGLVDEIQESGLLHFHATSTVHHAEKADAVGLDGVVATGWEAGGHIAKEEDAVHTFVLVPAIADAVDLPILAAGGCTDGRSLAASLALGADGIYMGTRFLAAHENAVHKNVKTGIVDAADTDSRVSTGLYGPMRVIDTPLIDRLNSMTEEERYPVEREALRSAGGGDHNEQLLVAGMGSGRIDAVETASQIVEETVAEAETILSELGKL
ncbi:nitronate monooxygenase [Halobellus sp. GM3]|uniref:nitronate monooxygenase n=1 Tax=Halobellus sp. GM3 TaxID=3458410 RepID=UPI00403DC6DE